MFVLKSVFWHIYSGSNCTPFPTSSWPDKAISAIPVKRPLNLGKRWHSTADYQTLLSRYFEVYFVPPLKIWSKKPCMKSRQIVNDCFILVLLSFVPKQRPNCTSWHHLTPRHWRRTFRLGGDGQSASIGGLCVRLFNGVLTFEVIKKVISTRKSWKRCWSNFDEFGVVW